ncbi:N-6 DNA methylase [Maribacter chungangensis]|uniref:site-specific DNA-methyltransferase (adenine-specific) n=1 Tax=Maribacter chungangensis TaxID=1069117 RepID=A0ABW3B258_9FLAO
MNNDANIQKEEYIKLIDKLYSFGMSNENVYLVLYILTCFKEGLELEVITEKSSINDDNTLFGKEENRLDLYYEKTRFAIKNIPEEKKIFLQVNDVFNKTIKDKRTSKVIIEYFQSDMIEQLEQYANSDNFEEVFDAFLEIIVGVQGKRGGEFVLPIEIGRFLIMLANLEGNASVFNPFAGLGTFGIELTEHQQYLGHEINALTWAVAVLRLNAHNRISHSDFLNADSFRNWPSSRKFDLVIANPPFRLRLSKKQQAEFSGEKFVEGFFLKEGIKLLEAKGKLITIVPQVFLTGHGDKKVRQFLVDKDLLEAVISFPGGLLMHTSIPFEILLINKNKTHKNEIVFFHGSEYVTKVNRYDKWFNAEGLLDEIRKTLGVQDSHVNEPETAYIPEGTLLPEFVSQDLIAENDYYLNLKRYWVDRIKGTALRDVIKIEKTISFREALKHFENTDEINYTERSPFMEFKHISTKDLKVDPKDFDINIEFIENKRVRNGKFINEDTYLVSLIGSNLKPSFLSPGNEIIHISNDVIPFTINEKLVDPNWLVRELNSTKVKDQLEVLVTGVIPRLRKQDFLNLKIHLPSLKEQREEIGKIQGLEKQVDDLESNIIEQNSYLRHTVAGPLSDLEHALNNIETIIKNISKNEMPQILDAKVSDNHLYTLGEHIEDSKKHVAIILDTIATKLSSSQSIEQKKLEKLNLLKHIDNYIKRKNENRTSLGYSIEFDFDRDFFNSSPNTHFEYVLGNKELINTLLDNMIDNAVKHAFIEGEKNLIEIYVWGYNEDTANERIFFTMANTGKRMPKNITLDVLKKRGFSNSSKQGDGFGLWLVNEIVRKHKADWFLVDDLGTDNAPEIRYSNILGRNIQRPKDDCVTKFSFSFPILEE